MKNKSSYSFLIEKTFFEIPFAEKLVNLINTSRKINSSVRTDVCVKVYCNAGMNYMGEFSKKFGISFPIGVSCFREEMYDFQMKEVEDACRLMIEGGYLHNL